ncbi:EamA family transporter [Halalkalibacillus sediminis]|uniref:EamA family transporter n=1 Tax=Halalkalibacillus sediminis TaxID=2018042 RepID=A0A2I0QQY0_9BACI|nr:DMT family transporter [Halalkalibacillus sediminis]PKR76729.1 EamA family transporter [Halalkalibacillus sediminis]
MRMNQWIAYSLVITGAALWGIVGLFVQYLNGYGLSSWDVVTVRLSLSSIILVSLLAIFSRGYLKIRLRDLPYFIALGVVSIAIFNWFYFQVMELASLSVAVVFVYSSPVFATIISYFFFREPITVAKLIAIVLTIFGSALAIEFIPLTESTLSMQTILFGLLAGLFCATYSLLGKDISRYYHPFTITCYAMVCGSLFLIPTSQIWQHHEVLMNPDVWVHMIGISIFSTVIAYLCYTIGLAYIESSRATILSSTEIVIAVLVGVLVFKENLTMWQFVGILFVLASLAITVFSFRNIIRTKQ